MLLLLLRALPWTCLRFDLTTSHPSTPPPSTQPLFASHLSDIPRLARKVRSMLERHRIISAWDLALAAAASVAAGSRSLSAAGTATGSCSAPPSPPALSPDSMSPRQAAEELVTHVTSLMAEVRLSKLAPLERLNMLTAALNAAVACIDPRVCQGSVVTSNGGKSERGRCAGKMSFGLALTPPRLYTFHGPSSRLSRTLPCTCTGVVASLAHMGMHIPCLRQQGKTRMS